METVCPVCDQPVKSNGDQGYRNPFAPCEYPELFNARVPSYDSERILRIKVIMCDRDKTCFLELRVYEEDTPTTEAITFNQRNYRALLKLDAKVSTQESKYGELYIEGDKFIEIDSSLCLTHSHSHVWVLMNPYEKVLTGIRLDALEWRGFTERLQDIQTKSIMV